MNTFRNIKKDAKALSPVVASIILIAVTVAVSVAVAAWMGGMTVGFMETEELKITNAQFDTQTAGSNTVTLTISNTGTTSVVISQFLVDNVEQATDATLYDETGTALTGLTLAKNAKGYTIEVTLDDDVVSGNSYALKLVSTKGNYYAYNAIAP